MNKIGRIKPRLKENMVKQPNFISKKTENIRDWGSIKEEFRQKREIIESR